MREIDTIIAHCSAHPTATMGDILSWHTVDPHNWDDIGYHYIIDFDGIEHEGRPLQIIGAHCKEYNRKSVGICILGLDKFSFKQLSTFRLLCYKIERIINTTIKLEVKGHYEFNPRKTCPNINANLLRDFVKCERYLGRKEIYKKMGVC